ncbi:protein BatD [candidate division KSB1 bacterium]|nr:protein BatD [candidate division KSB1 bacterium]
MRYRIAKSLFFQIFLIYVSSGFAADLTIQATVNRTVIQLNQQFSLTVELSGDGANDLSTDPVYPATMEAFAVPIGGSNTSQSIQIINGRMSVTRSIQFSFIASKVGKFVIDPIPVEYNGKTYTSKSINIEIVKSAATPQRNQRQQSSQLPSPDDDLEESLFLKTSVSKARVFQNEPVIVTYKIYTKVNINTYGISKLPNTAGFWAEDFEMSQSPSTYEEIIDGKKFLVADIKKMALFPTGSGTKTIDPMVIECDVRMPRRRRSRDIFDFFDDPFFGRTVRKRVSSPPVQITVLPLPEEGKPKNFSGAVGNFKLSATVDKTSVETNEAVNLKVKLTGVGNIKILPTPEITMSSDIEQYPPSIHENIERSGDTISGSKVFEYVLIPRLPGVQKIKPMQFSYFDIAKKSYKTLVTPEIEINVKKGKREFISSGSGFVREEVKLLGQDIRYIEQSIPEFKKAGQFYYQSPGFFLLLAIPLLLTGGALGYRRYADKLTANIAYARARRANQVANAQLKRAKKLLKESTRKEFYSEISRALTGFLANKLNIEEAGLMTANVKELLAERNIAEELISDYLECIQVCDFQRFAPTASSIDEMQAFLQRVKECIIKIQRAIA